MVCMSSIVGKTHNPGSGRNAPIRTSGLGAAGWLVGMCWAFVLLRNSKL